MTKTINTESLFGLEWSMIQDKLEQGANGVEWLVLNHISDSNVVRGLDGWIEGLQLYGHNDFHQVVLDTLSYDSEAFYEKYEFNWWLSVRYSFEYLSQLCARNYDTYFSIIQKLENKGENNIG
ncbi:hypothetical protein [Paenibacillus sp. QZ-Y1]|uniref:hypothetical protein n=1 Tax=Paenibacillus sp. QZ-Y1 TaxID=3414511 RepID=UPI003F78D7F9